VVSWATPDDALTNIAQSIRQVVLEFQPPDRPTDRISPAERWAPQPRMLDAAIPSHIVKARATELLVLIRLPDSPGLRGVLQIDEIAEARADDVLSSPLSLRFPAGPDGRPGPLKVTVKLTSPDFAPAVQAKNLFVPVDGDSEVCPFMLTPVRTGQLRVLVELQWEDALRGHRRLVTECVAESTSVPANSEMLVVRMPVMMDLSTVPASSERNIVHTPVTIGETTDREHYPREKREDQSRVLARPGEFTEFFRGRAEVPHADPTAPAPDLANQPTPARSDLTQLFGASSNESLSPRAPEPTEQSERGDFTEVLGKDRPDSNPLSVPHLTPDELADSPEEGDQIGEYFISNANSLPIAPGKCDEEPVFRSTTQVGGPTFDTKHEEGATRVFKSPAHEEAPALPPPAREGEHQYTRINKGPKREPTGSSASLRPTMAALPASVFAPKPPALKKPKNWTGYTPLIIILNLVFLAGVGLVLYFIFKR
jgi:hypothetical protein